MESEFLVNFSHQLMFGNPTIDEGYKKIIAGDIDEAVDKFLEEFSYPYWEPCDEDVVIVKCGDDFRYFTVWCEDQRHYFHRE